MGLGPSTGHTILALLQDLVLTNVDWSGALESVDALCSAFESLVAEKKKKKKKSYTLHAGSGRGKPAQPLPTH
jgi:hypothetical protein